MGVGPIRMDAIEEFGDDIALKLNVDARSYFIGDVGHGNHEEKIKKIEFWLWLRELLLPPKKFLLFPCFALGVMNGVFFVVHKIKRVFPLWYHTIYLGFFSSEKRRYLSVSFSY